MKFISNFGTLCYLLTISLATHTFTASKTNHKFLKISNFINLKTKGGTTPLWYSFEPITLRNMFMVPYANSAMRKVSHTKRLPLMRHNKTVSQNVTITRSNRWLAPCFWTRIFLTSSGLSLLRPQSTSRIASLTPRSRPTLPHLNVGSVQNPIYLIYARLGRTAPLVSSTYRVPNSSRAEKSADSLAMRSSPKHISSGTRLHAQSRSAVTSFSTARLHRTSVKGGGRDGSLPQIVEYTRC